MVLNSDSESLGNNNIVLTTTLSQLPELLSVCTNTPAKAGSQVVLFKKVVSNGMYCTCCVTTLSHPNWFG